MSKSIIEDDSRSVVEIRPRHVGLVLILILVLGALFRFAYLREAAADPLFDRPLYDPQYNDYWARALATGDWTLPPGVSDPEIRTTPYGRPPGYPYFLAGIYAVFGLDPLIPRLVQMGLGLLNVLLMFFLGRRLLGAAAGLLSAALLAFYWAFPYFEAQLTYPALAITLLLLAMLALSAWFNRPRFWAAVAAGLLLGLFALLRPNGLLYVPVLACWMIWQSRERGRALLRGAIPLLLSVAAVLAPPLVRNYAVSGEFVFVSSYGGLNLYVGNHEGAEGTEPRVPGLQVLAGIESWCCFDYPSIVRGLGRKTGNPDISFGEANRWFYGQAWDFIRTHPGAVARQLWRKTLLFWGPVEVTNDTVMEWDKRNSPVLGPLPGFAFVMALFAAGIVALAWERLRRQDRDSDGIACSEDEERQGSGPMMGAVLLFILTYFLSVVPFFVAGRYRMPVLPFVLMIGAGGVVSMVRAARRGALWRAAVLLVCAIGAGIGVSWNAAGYEASLSTWHFRRGVAYSLAGQFTAAADEYRAGIAAGDAASGVYNNLARLLIKEGDAEGGLRTFEEGLKQYPGNALLLNGLGYELQCSGRVDEAEAQYRAAIDANPAFHLARTNLGHVLLGRGDYAGALAQYEEVARLDAGDGVAWNNVGLALHKLKRLDEAEKSYRRSADLAPYLAAPRINLGDLLLESGRREEAVAEYRRALAIEPGNAVLQKHIEALTDAR